MLSSVQLSQKNYLEKTAKNLEMQSLPEILNVSVRSKARGTSGMLEAAVGLVWVMAPELWDLVYSFGK